MKQILCFLLVFCFIFSVVTVAFAGNEEVSSDANTEESVIQDDTVDSNNHLKSIHVIYARFTPIAVIIKNSMGVSALQPPIKIATQAPVASLKIIKAPLIWQYPEFPTGCESVAAVMNLQYYGLDVSVDEFVDNYLYKGRSPYWERGIRYSCDPDEVFLGDPRSEKGWGIWAKGLEKSIRRCLKGCYSNLSVKTTYSESIYSLCKKYINNDIPVLVWVTAYMEKAHDGVTATIIGTKNKFTWISPNHCMLLVGYDKEYYYFNDPLTGKVEKYEKSVSESAFECNDSRAVIITER